MDPRLEIILAAKDVTGKTFATVNKQVGALTKSVLSLNGVMVTLAGATGMGLLVKTNLDAVAAIEKNATMAGVSVKAYQELDYVATQHQITVDSLTDGLKELSLRTDEYVVTGAGPAKEAFERLGYSQTELNTMLADTPALLQDVIRRMEGLDQAAKIRIADELFGGTGGEQFVAMINAGASSFKRLRQAAHDLGVVMDEDLIKNSVETKKQIDALTKVLSVNFQSVIAGLAPDIAKIAENTTDWVSANKKLIAQDLPGMMKSYAGEVKAFVESDTFAAIKEYWEIILGGAIGARFGGVGAVLGAGAGAYYSLYKDAQGMMAPPGDAKAEQLNMARQKLKSLEETYADLKGNDLKYYGLRYQRDIENQKKYIAELTKEYEALIAAKEKSAAVSNEAVHTDSNPKTGGKKNKPAPPPARSKNYTPQDFGLDPYFFSAGYNTPAGIGKTWAVDTSELDARIEATEKKLEIEKQFQLDYKQITMSTFDFERDRVEAQFNEYSKFVDDKTALDEWRSAEMKRIADEEASFAKETASEWEDAFAGWANTFSGTLNDMLWESEVTFGNIAESFGKMVTQMMIQQQMIDPFVKSVGPSIGNMGSSIAKFLGFHDGGVPAEGEHSFVRSLPKFHTGVGPDEVLSIIKKDEGVFTPGQMKALGGAINEPNNVELHFHNAPQVKETKRSRGRSGMERVDVFFENQMTGVAAGQNSFTNTLETRYGLTPVLGGR